MRRLVGVTLAAAVVLAGGAALAQGPGGPASPRPMGSGGGMMAGPGWADCPGMTAGGGTVPQAGLTEQKATERAAQYAAKYLPGFTVERVLPFSGMHNLTMYQAELKGPEGESRILHVNPWGNVMPFGGPIARR